MKIWQQQSTGERWLNLSVSMGYNKPTYWINSKGEMEYEGTATDREKLEEVLQVDALTIGWHDRFFGESQK